MKNGPVEFESPMDKKAFLSNLKAKLPLVEKRPEDEIRRNDAVDKAIGDAFLNWAGKRLNKDLHQLFKTPEGTNFTLEEVDLAGWIHEYSGLSKLPFNTAMENVLDYLKRHPLNIERYAKNTTNFAETASGSVSAVLADCTMDDSTAEIFRRARIYQAGHSGCNFAYAVQMTKR